MMMMIIIAFCRTLLLLERTVYKGFNIVPTLDWVGFEKI